MIRDALFSDVPCYSWSSGFRCHSRPSLFAAPPPLPARLQVFLLLVAFVAVPWMLLPKPLILNARYKAQQVIDCVPD
jgi:hypothetical protein